MIEAVWPNGHYLIVGIWHRVTGFESGQPGVREVSGRAAWTLLWPRRREVGQEDVGRKLHCLLNFFIIFLARNQELKR